MVDGNGADAEHDDPRQQKQPRVQCARRTKCAKVISSPRRG
jgi:hypothetical protein